MSDLCPTGCGRNRVFRNGRHLMTCGATECSYEMRARRRRGVAGPRRPLSERFHEKYERGGDAECWIWIGSRGGKNRQYGKIGRGGKSGGSDYAHRVSWELENGRSVPEGMEVDHECKVTLCVNPRHLRIVTPLKNKQLERKETCGRGHRDQWAVSYRGWRYCKACRAEWAREKRRMGK